MEQLQAAGVDLALLAEGIARDGVRLHGLQAEIDRLQREMNALGAVNLAALEELGSARERKGFLDAQNADLVLVVTRTSLVSLAALRLYLPALTDSTGSERLALGLIGSSMPYGRAEVQQQFGVTIAADLAFEPEAAAVLSDGAPPPRRFAGSGYVRGRKMVGFLVCCIALAISAAYELIEWWAALAMGQGADDFLGTQGDPWDTQSDMFCALLGALTTVLLLGRALLQIVGGDKLIIPFC